MGMVTILSHKDWVKIVATLNTDSMNQASFLFYFPIANQIMPLQRVLNATSNDWLQILRLLNSKRNTYKCYGYSDSMETMCKYCFSIALLTGAASAFLERP